MLGKKGSEEGNCEWKLRLGQGSSGKSPNLLTLTHGWFFFISFLYEKNPTRGVKRYHIGGRKS